MNLLSNAVKYNPPGGRVAVRGKRDGDTVVLSVADTGPGLSDAQHKRLFQPFNRLGAERGSVEGTGIGLVITRRLVELMRGRIEVSSEPGTGSVFNVYLPAADEPPAPTVDAGAPRTGTTAGPLLTLLYVEDNVVDRLDAD